MSKVDVSLSIIIATQMFEIRYCCRCRVAEPFLNIKSIKKDKQSNQIAELFLNIYVPFKLDLPLALVCVCV